ncbi:tetratricopeptide repeat protein [Propionivibrio sp.]|uniref:tetratricopeptide repeat protein n=1 Tax=Propionivibrio sp. TaxID=2212460 RepID=UPI0026319052|nr:tetratricopeptide repeat protein [Propionivibrio sp.]
MSLINQMLQDLDTRQHGAGNALPNDVRPLPQLQPSRLPLILGSLAVLVLGGFSFYQLELMTPPDPPLAPAIVAAVTPPPVADPEQRVQVEAAPEVQASAVDTLLQELDGSLRMAEFITSQAEKSARKKPVKAAIGDDDKKSAQANSKPEADEHQPSAIGKLVRSTQIERTDSIALPRERTESEYRKAIGAVNQGRVVEAVDGLRIALREDSLHTASRQLLVKLLLEAKRLDEAVQVLQDGLQGQPAQIGWAMNLARLQVDRGDLVGAWQTLNYSQPAAGNNADYQGFTAHVLQRLGRNRDAAEHYRAATRLSPGEGRWWLGLGLTLEADGRSDEAREMFIRARQSGNLSTELMALAEQKLR